MNVRLFGVQLIRSGIGRDERQKRTLKGLGLTRFGRKVYLKDTPAIRGMLYKVSHLVEVDSEQPVDGLTEGLKENQA